MALPTLQEAVAGGAWQSGPSEMLAEYLKGVEEKYPGVERINVRVVMGMPGEGIKDQLSPHPDLPPGGKGLILSLVAGGLPEAEEWGNRAELKP